MNRHVVQTKDQSSTIYVPELDEHYHSMHGALQESQHIFIDSGLKQLTAEKETHLLEIGFGTGLNALLTLLESEKSHQKIHYTALEKYPVSLAEMEQLNYADQLHSQRAGQLMKKLHLAQWEHTVEITPSFSLLKLKTDLKSCSAPPSFHLIYFDAFAPSAQPNLWTTEIFEKMHQCLLPGGMLVTYCVKGEVRRNMKAAGLEVEKIPGPPGKWEMARARKP